MLKHCIGKTYKNSLKQTILQMKITLARIITGKGKYAFRPMFCVLKQVQKMVTFLGDKTPQNINIFSSKIKQSPQSLIYKQYSSENTNHNNQIGNQTAQAAQSNQVRLVSDRHKLAYGNRCIGWESVHRPRRIQNTKARIVQQHRGFTMLDKNQPLLSFCAWRFVIAQSQST